MNPQAAYFDELYGNDADPWQVGSSWYERRKRALLLAALPRERYGLVFEPGCGNGEMTDALAGRCDALHACDLSPQAVALASRRTARHAHVQVDICALPTQWPAEGSVRYDLIVISELAYYLDDDSLERFFGRCARSLAPGGEIVCCHWRHPFHDRQQETAALHQACGRQSGLRSLVQHEDTDFLLQLWRQETNGRPKERT